MNEQSNNKLEKSFWRENWIELTLTAMMVAIIGWMARLMTQPTQTPREAALEAVILTAASLLASFLITKIYAEATYSKSLRDHGVQIASGIMVLKRQIESLTDWVAQKRSSISHPDRASDNIDPILEHVEQTLEGFRGMTDSALGGIAGVIGDALAQYETVMEQVSKIRIEALNKTKEIQQEIQSAASSEQVATLQAQIQEIEIRTQKQISHLARTSALPIPELPSKRTFADVCPYCSRKNSFEMVDQPGETQVITCQFCQRGFNAHVASGHRVSTRPLMSITHSKVSDLQASARRFLIDTDAWVEPVQLGVLIPLVVSFDLKMKEVGDTRTPYQLQSTILAESDTLSQAGVSNSSARKFFKLVYQGRAYRFQAGSPIGFKSIYVNDITEDVLLRAFIKTCIKRLLNALALTPNDSLEITELLLGDRFAEGGVMVKEIISEMERKLTIGAS